MSDIKELLSKQLREVACHAEDVWFEAARLYDDITEALEAVIEFEDELEPGEYEDVRLVLDAVQEIADGIVAKARGIAHELRAVDPDDKPAPVAETTTTETVDAA